MIQNKKVGVFILERLLILFLALGVWAQVDIEEHRRCVHCNMDRKAYGFSRMLLQFEDGAAVGVCSIHCAAIELLADTTRGVKSIQVADRNTRILLDAGKAYWVLGGKKPGVMTRTAKWAFAEKNDAERFIKKYGGEQISFTEALEAAKTGIINNKIARRKF